MITEHTISGRILALRDSKGVQQQELAAALKISPSALRNLEHGDTMPRLSTLELLSDFFNVSIDYLVRGVTSDGDNLNIYRTTGLNDTALAFLGEQIDIGDNCGGKNEYITALNAIVTGGLPNLAWGLKALNSELASIDADLKKVLEESPKPESLIEEMQLSNKLEPLRERRDLLKLRFLRSVEHVFDNLIIKEEAE